MANREALRELQNRLAAKLQAAKTEARAPGWLAVESGGHGFLLPLAEAGEIFGVASLIPVPHTSRWFLGVANLRGGLHGVVDLAGFLGLRALTDGTRDGAQLVAFNPVFEVNCRAADRSPGWACATLPTRCRLEASADEGRDAANTSLGTSR